MADNTFKNIRLGIFVLAAAALLILALYFVGARQNLFGNTFTVTAEFYDVNGLTPGNNVRLSGINVGTVDKVEIVSDSAVRVTMVIENEMRQFIHKNAIVSIGTDGLMGNKLININAGGGDAPVVEEGDLLSSRVPVDPDEMIRTLNETNKNMQVITYNLRTITDRFQSENSVWALLMDTMVAQNVKASIVNIRAASSRSAIITGDLAAISGDIRNGKGSIGALITDTTFSDGLKQVIVRFNSISDSAAEITGDISSILGDVRGGKGTLGVLLTDTSLVHNLNTGVTNINAGSVLLNEDLKAVRSSWPFRRYFRKQQRLGRK
jgi:phospholipid/cholesterol/gamma-HCH transport system substrate-binding protein